MQYGVLLLMGLLTHPTTIENQLLEIQIVILYSVIVWKIVKLLIIIEGILSLYTSCLFTEEF